MTNSLPKFDRTIGPDCERFFRADELSRKLQDQRDQNTREHRALIDQNRVLKDTFVREYSTSGPRKPSRAEELVSEVLPFESNKSGLSEDDRAALYQYRNLNSTWQELTDALQILGDKTLHWHGLACREFCQTIREEHYQPIAVEIAEAMLALGRAMDKQDRFIADLRAMNVTQPSHLLLVETPRWRDLLRQLRSAAEHGYLPKEAIPRDWRNRE